MFYEVPRQLGQRRLGHSNLNTPTETMTTGILTTDSQIELKKCLLIMYLWSNSLQVFIMNLLLDVAPTQFMTIG